MAGPLVALRGAFDEQADSVAGGAVFLRCDGLFGWLAGGGTVMGWVAGGRTDAGRAAGGKADRGSMPAPAVRRESSEVPHIPQKRKLGALSSLQLGQITVSLRRSFPSLTSARRGVPRVIPY